MLSQKDLKVLGLTCHNEEGQNIEVRVEEEIITGRSIGPSHLKETDPVDSGCCKADWATLTATAPTTFDHINSELGASVVGSSHCLGFELVPKNNTKS